MLIYSRAVDSELEPENMEEVTAVYDRGVKVSKHLTMVSPLMVFFYFPLQEEVGMWNRQFRVQLPEEQANALEQADPLNIFSDENAVEGDGDEDAVIVQEEEVERLGHLSRDASMGSMVD
jgi:hypothetical protein